MHVSFPPSGVLCLVRIDGVMRTMNTEKLIKTLPIIQNQLDALLDFQVPMACTCTCAHVFVKVLVDLNSNQNVN